MADATLYDCTFVLSARPIVKAGEIPVVENFRRQTVVWGNKPMGRCCQTQKEKDSKYLLFLVSFALVLARGTCMHIYRLHS